jgi:hypothetical protein
MKDTTDDKKYMARNIHFADVGSRKIRSQPDEALKLLKIKGAFECSDEDAKIILSKITAGESIPVTHINSAGMSRFGIRANIDYENIEARRNRIEAEAIAKHERELKIAAATSWFDTLSPEHKEYVALLPGGVGAVG